jgi:hypothetical protein
MSKDEIRSIRAGMLAIGFKFSGRPVLSETNTPYLNFTFIHGQHLALRARNEAGTMRTFLEIGLSDAGNTVGTPDDIRHWVRRAYSLPDADVSFLHAAIKAVKLLESYCGSQKVSSSTSVEALIKTNEYYQWFIYTGQPRDLMSGAGTPLYLKKGQVFGVRKSASGKKIRMITEDLGPNKVFTLLPEVALDLAKHCKPTEAVAA